MAAPLIGWVVWMGIGGSGPVTPPCDPDESVAVRMERRTRPLLGQSYLRSPLGEGEGEGPDPDARFRLDAFDCTTFVETALALSRCGEDPETLMDAIRYVDHTVAFDHRRHLVTTQWVPGLVADGWVRDVSQTLFPESVKRTVFWLSPERWDARVIARDLELPRSALPFGRHEVAYVPLEVLQEPQARARIPAGAILNVVRVDWPKAPDLVTHQVLVVHKRGALWVRHASPHRKRVLDEPLADFVAAVARRPYKWPVAGLQILEPAGLW